MMIDWIVCASPVLSLFFLCFFSTRSVLLTGCTHDNKRSAAFDVVLVFLNIWTQMTRERENTSAPSWLKDQLLDTFVRLCLVVALVVSPALFQCRLLLPRLVDPVPVFLQRLFVRRVRRSAVRFDVAKADHAITTQCQLCLPPLSTSTNRANQWPTHVLSTAAVTFSPCARHARGLASRCLQRINSRLASAHSWPRIRAAHVRLVLSVSGSFMVWRASSSMAVASVVPRA